MKIGIQLPKFGIGLFSSILLLALLFNSCQGDPVELPDDDVFTKEKREQLGKMLLNDILTNNDFVPQISPYDTTVYWYVQTLYTQATNVMQMDSQSPSDNRWKGGWEIFIIDNDDLKHTFVLPGGDIFITTGMLKSFNKDYELYYLMTFEAILMNDGLLMEALKKEYNSLTLLNLIEGRTPASGVTISDLAANLPYTEFDESIVKENDRKTVRTICGTSILSPTGINLSLFNADFQNAKWLETRKSYSERTDAIQEFAEDNEGDCGGNLGSGNYGRYILDVLN